jgi:hypothetical protein
LEVKLNYHFAQKFNIMKNVISKLVIPLIIVFLVLIVYILSLIKRPDTTPPIDPPIQNVFKYLNEKIEKDFTKWNKTAYLQTEDEILDYTKNGKLNAGDSKNLLDKLKVKALSAYIQAVNELCSFNSHNIVDLEQSASFFPDNNSNSNEKIKKYRYYEKLCTKAVNYFQDEAYEPNKHDDFVKKFSEFKADPSFNTNPHLNERIKFAQDAVGELRGGMKNKFDRLNPNICNNCDDISGINVLFYDKNLKLIAKFYAQKCKEYNRNLPETDQCPYRN